MVIVAMYTANLVAIFADTSVSAHPVEGIGDFAKRGVPACVQAESGMNRWLHVSSLRRDRLERDI